MSPRWIWLVCLLSFQIQAFADFSLDWWTVDGGGADLNTGSYSLTGTIGQPDVGHLSSDGFTLDGGFWGALQTLTLNLFRVDPQQQDVAETDLIVAPIVPTTNNGVLNTCLPLGQGVVADGVTPVLLRLEGSATDCSLEISLDPAVYPDGLLGSKIFVLQGEKWENSTRIPATNWKGGFAYCYLQGMEWDEFATNLTLQEITCTLTIRPANGSQTTTWFKIRPPPVVLVHGYNTDSNTWSGGFLNQLRSARSSDFIIPVEYGTSWNTHRQGSGPGGYSEFTTKSWEGNTSGSLSALAAELDQVLTKTVEAKTSRIRSNWAFTRYDVVGHSQGGVLTRMLCQTNSGKAAFGSSPVVCKANSFRGRFRRVITLGSPHNGSLILHYLLRMKNYGPIERMVYGALEGLAQPKFDPFEEQIQVINKPGFEVDGRIPFNCLGSTIFCGMPPKTPNKDEPAVPLSYKALGLCTDDPLYLDQTRGEVLLPRGSDGVVDLESQLGGEGTSTTRIWNSKENPKNVAHADASNIFGVQPLQSQTTDPRIAQKVVELLSGPRESTFGAFHLPKRLTPDGQQQRNIDQIVPDIQVFDCIVKAIRPNDVSSNHIYQLRLPANVPPGGQVVWYAEVLGTNGISSTGVSLKADTNSARFVTVTVENLVQGDVVLYVNYVATNHTMVVGTPVLVESRPVGSALIGIELDPLNANLLVSQDLATRVWGDYTNGIRSLLYVSPGDAIYSSADTNIASVNSNGIVTMKAPGTATIKLNYMGFEAQSVVTSSQPTGIIVTGMLSSDGVFQLTFSGSLGSTNIVEGSSDLTDWRTLAVIPNTNSVLKYSDPSSIDNPRRFYRVRIP